VIWTGEGEKGKLPGIWLLIALIVGILILGDLTRRMIDARQLEVDARTLATEVAGLEFDNIQLQTRIAEVTSEASIAHWARSEAMMIREGERLIIPVPAAGIGVQPTATPTPLNDPPSNFRIWWALISGG
jgi:cell division protein FtsB